MTGFSDDIGFSVTPFALRTQVEDKLRQAIVTGYFKAGEHLSDRSLCETFGVSRALIRESIRRLEAEGLIEIIPYRGAFVRQMSCAEATQVYDVRCVLEALAARLFARLATDAEIAELKRVLARIEAFGTGDRSEGILDLKKKFYDVLLRGAGNKYVEHMLSQLLNSNMLLRATSLSNPDRLPNTIREIARIIDAIERRDEEAAWRASFEHVRRASEVAIAILKAQESADADGSQSPEVSSARNQQ